ncbi:hypothetical protein Tsubulata_039573, partial [Turnera subulata]
WAPGICKDPWSTTIPSSGHSSSSPLRLYIHKLDQGGGPDGTLKTYQATVCVISPADVHSKIQMQVLMLRPQPPPLPDDGTTAA